MKTLFDKARLKKTNLLKNIATQIFNGNFLYYFHLKSGKTKKNGIG